MACFSVVPYVVIHGGLTGSEGRLVKNTKAAIIRIRDHDRTEDDETTIDALLKKAESGVDELGPMLKKALGPGWNGNTPNGPYDP